MTPAPGTSANQAESFTTMSLDTDLDSVGAHCQHAYCHQLDFLPFRCESCKGTFCLDHRSERAHSCTHAGEWAAARRAADRVQGTPTPGKPTVLNASQCSHPACKTYINTHTSVGVACQNCRREYCLKHRLREDHDCASLIPLGVLSPSGPSQADKAMTALNRLRLWGREKQAVMLPKSKPSSKATQLLATNALKRTAKGDEKLPMDKRMYLYVEAEATTTTSKLPKGEFYYSRDWSVGRMLDAAAKGLQIQNVNNRAESEEDKLRVFHVEAGRLLEYPEKLGDVCQIGNTLVLLRGVGPAS